MKRVVEKLILKCGLAPGDIVMLTAAVRDLHRTYPGRFKTAVKTSCSPLWDNNPYVSKIAEDDPEARVIECACPLINRSNIAPYHYIHAFIEFLNDTLGLAIKPTEFKGDIHLSPQEKAWFSQIHELTGEDTPFWIVAAGGKYDLTIKWWNTERYQAVIDHFKGKIQFVQIGAKGHFHPKLHGTIDLRGQTDLRQFVRLVYHAQGVLCGVTASMHLAAAVEAKAPQIIRPCVVVAGGREPVHWEAYPNHQFIANNGSLPCCAHGGCWKSRTLPLGDGDERDNREHLCVDVRGDLPRCMDMISPGEVIRRIETYFDGGMCGYLTGPQNAAATRAVEATVKSDYDETALTVHNARIVCERFIRNIPKPPRSFSARGIVMCGGGPKYFTNAWVSIRMLRQLGCVLPIQLWHLGGNEIDPQMASLLHPFNAECIDASEVAKSNPVRRLGGWQLKPFAIINSPFKEALLLDADNVAVKNPEFLFDTPQYLKTGAIFWPDICAYSETNTAWESCGIPTPEGAQFESGQIVVDKERCWEPLRLALWFNEHSDFYYQHVHGDKETFHLAWHKLRRSYSFIPTPVERLLGTMCQHDFEGNRLFQHRNMDKWNLFRRNRRISGFLFEDECRQFLEELRECWDGGTGKYVSKMPQFKRPTALPSIKLCMISTAARDELRQETLRSLAQSDWGEPPAVLEFDTSASDSAQIRQTETARRALEQCLSCGADFFVFVEDDVVFNSHLRHNLSRWKPLLDGRVSLAGLYNPGIRPLAWGAKENFTLVSPYGVYGSQGFLISEHALKYIVAHWDEAEGMQDLRMSRLAAQLQDPLFYHTPSLVQHVGKESLWGGGFHSARDFDPNWKA